ncbi:hypothetical protein H2248_007057 [Termitomyces sp. 'cryptogamus']|nr:hypothetical protein H2248_007981 [Termitomyces sp. 'cryptogamus']KAH0585764.1 hypothetical protein H2248_007057 [Termitomyces sp. 'cryptogamus']
MSLRPLNTSQKPPTFFPFTFSIAPDTDLWLKPAPLDKQSRSLPLNLNNQPTFYVSIPLSRFIRATTTISFMPTVHYGGDQAGLVILYPDDETKWIKGGLEYADDILKQSVVVTTGQDNGADWSVSPPVSGTTDSTGRVRTVVEFEREEEGTGASLLIRIGGEEVREVTWVFVLRKIAMKRSGLDFLGRDL